MTIFAGSSDVVGTWTGTNGFRLMAADPMHDAPASAEVSVAAGRNLVAIAYSWSHPDDGPQDGFLVLGADGDAGEVMAFWGDSWHQSPEPRVLTGGIDEGVATVGADYGGGWRWEIAVDPTAAGALRLQMDNVIPEGAGAGSAAGAYPVMVMDLRRAVP